MEIILVTCVSVASGVDIDQAGSDIKNCFSKVISGESTISQAKKECINSVENKKALKYYRYINIKKGDVLSLF